MLLGSKTVDLPYDIRDLFIKAGLAHVLAASGFHTSLLLGLVLGVTRKANRRTRLIVSSLTLIAFLSLTGFNPSTFRAVLMGLAALLGIGIKHKIKQLKEKQQETQKENNTCKENINNKIRKEENNNE